jgi:hypothetical protein
MRSPVGRREVVVSGVFTALLVLSILSLPSLLLTGPAYKSWPFLAAARDDSTTGSGGGAGYYPVSFAYLISASTGDAARAARLLARGGLWKSSSSSSLSRYPAPRGGLAVAFGREAAAAAVGGDGEGFAASLGFAGIWEWKWKGKEAREREMEIFGGRNFEKGKGARLFVGRNTKDW